MSELDHDDALPPGSMIGERYRVVRQLGQGGMGAVYEAENTWTKRRVAIKVLLPALSSDSRAVSRFQGEAQAATRLQHPNIVDVLDMGKDPQTGAVYIVQEFLRGEDLHGYITKRGRLTPAAAAEALVPIMGALAVAHERSIIHRDIKPENIFLVGGGAGEMTPKLIDFGLAKVLGEDANARKTSTGTIMGTPYYMSPEQARGDRTVDARTDIWAIGAVLFELLTGDVPYDAPSANLIIVKLLTSAPPRLQDVAPELPESVAAIVGRAMEPDIDKRYQTMREMLTHVLACSGFQEPGARTTLRERFARSIEHVPPADTDTAAPQDAPARRSIDASLPTQAAIPVSHPAPAPAPSIRPGDPAPKAPTQESWERERVPSVVAAPPAKKPVAVLAALGLALGLGAIGAVVVLNRAPDPAAAAQPPTAAIRAAANPTPPPAANPTPPPAAPPPAAPPPAAPSAPPPAAEQDAGAAPVAAPADEPSRASRRHRRHRERSTTGGNALAPVGP